jgi:RNA polymerase sigma-70 factor, ECF subfamily
MVSRAWSIDLSIYPDEAALLEGLRERDRYACSCMLKRFGPRMYRVALQITGDEDEAEDVLQEALIRSCERIDDFEGLSALGSWLHRITVNTALMHLRRRKRGINRVTSFEDDPATQTLNTLIDPQAEPGEELLSLELREEVERAVLGLPDTLRTAFVLREIEGFSTQESAGLLGIGESALKVRLHRARHALRDALTPYLRTATTAEET